MVKPPTRVKGGLLLFSSADHREVYIEQAVRVRVQEKIRDHIRSIPGLTPEREAQEWAEITLAHASVTSRKEVGRKRKRGSS